MTEKEKISLNRLEKYCRTEASKDFMIELFKLAGSYLNAGSITWYAETQNISYPGAVKRLKPQDILNMNGLKVVIDNN